MDLTWQIKTWDELTRDELYDIIALRIDVFVIEQNCPYQDADGKDRNSLHVWAINEACKPVACARLVKPGVSYTEWAIGRVVTAQSARGAGVGQELMRQCMNYFADQRIDSVRISAQSYLKKFYEGFGFRQVSEEYLEDNIPHIEMLFQHNHNV
jgi:ElaA protein